ncbi:MAG: SAF domain-containing protein [Eubacteriales bacterium]|nr:SAF domain-containing protein [Eubacteriales bacterium]
MFGKLKLTMRERLPKSEKNSRLMKAAICFAIAILCTMSVYAAQQEQTSLVSVVKAGKTIPAGTQIKASDIKVVEVGSYGLPEDAAKEAKFVAGKYARSDIYTSDFITPDKISEKQEDPFSGISGNRKIMSFSVSNLAASVANNIKVGDTIQVIYGETATDPSGNETIITVAPDCLKNLTVIDIKDVGGYEQNAEKVNSSGIYSASSFIPAVVTVEVDDEQADALYKAEMAKNIYVIFILRER